MLMLLHEMKEDNIILSPNKQSEFLDLMIENMHNYKNESERLTALHGDFWAAFYEDPFLIHF